MAAAAGPPLRLRSVGENVRESRSLEWSERRERGPWGWGPVGVVGGDWVPSWLPDLAAPTMESMEKPSLPEPAVALELAFCTAVVDDG